MFPRARTSQRCKNRHDHDAGLDALYEFQYIVRFMSTKRRKARPTLQGLIVEDESRFGTAEKRTLYPWSTVSRIAYQQGQSVWSPYDGGGQSLTDDGRRLRFRVQGERANLVARDAQARRFLHDWKNGQLKLTEIYERSRLSAVAFLAPIFLLGIMFGMMLVWFILRSRSDNITPLFEPDYQRLIWFFLVAWSIMAAIPLAGAFWLFISGAVRPNVRKASFNKEGVWALLNDGTEVKRPWTELDKIRCNHLWGSIRFFDGQTLRFWIQGHSRTRHVLDTILGHFYPEISARNKRSSQRALVRSGTYTIAGGVVFGYLTFLLGGEDLSRESRLVRAAIAASIMALFGIALIFLPELIARPKKRTRLFWKRFWASRRAKSKRAENIYSDR